MQLITQTIWQALYNKAFIFFFDHSAIIWKIDQPVLSFILVIELRIDWDNALFSGTKVGPAIGMSNASYDFHHQHVTIITIGHYHRSLLNPCITHEKAAEAFIATGVTELDRIIEFLDPWPEPMIIQDGGKHLSSHLHGKDPIRSSRAGLEDFNGITCQVGGGCPQAGRGPFRIGMPFSIHGLTLASMCRRCIPGILL